MQAPWEVEHAAAAGIKAGGAATPAVQPAAAKQVTQAALQAVWQTPQAIGPASMVPQLNKIRATRQNVKFWILVILQAVNDWIDLNTSLVSSKKV